MANSMLFDKNTDYERWTPPSLGSTSSLTAARSAHSATIDADQPDPSLRWPTAGELEQIHNDAHREGYAAGYEEGTARVRMEAARLHTLFEQLEQALSDWNDGVAREVAELGIEIARQVIDQSLVINPQAVTEVVREAIAQLPQQHTSVFLNPEDATLVRTQIGEQLSHAGHRIFEDAALSRGGCRVEASGSQIDGTLETRWRRVVEPLTKNAQWVERHE